MNIMTISGSARKGSSNVKLLEALPYLFPQHHIYRFDQLNQFPVFAEIEDENSYPKIVMDWRKAITDADAIIIATPEYIHNVPALIKNALEWVTASGELHQKKVLPITFLPNEPRGAKAMESMLWSLRAMEANIVAQLPLYQNEIEFGENGKLVDSESVELLKEAIQLLED